MIVLGVDAWKKGWVAVVSDGKAVLEVITVDGLEELASRFADADSIAVDIPIGLLDRGRAADVEARRFVGPRASSVFRAPPLSVLAAESYTEARRISKQRFDTGVSAQSYALRASILEADRIARHDRRLREVHPEVSFCALAGRPLAHAKRTWNGQMERRRLLASVGLELPDHLPDDVGNVPVDDVLDATVAAWSAARIAGGEARSLPDPPESEESGYPIAIWY